MPPTESELAWLTSIICWQCWQSFKRTCQRHSLSGIHVLNEGAVCVEVGQHRERLRQIKFGQVSWEDVEQWRQSLHQQLNTAFEGTSLPERPDYETANAFPVKARRSALKDA